MKQMKRILALFLAVLCFCMIPLSAFAETLDEISAVVTAEQETKETTADIPPQESETAPEPGAASTGPAEDETPPVAPTEGETEQPAEPTQPEREYVPGFEVVLPGGVYGWPVPSSTTVSQGYGSGVHDALDIAAAEGEAVLAAEAGTVTAVQIWDGVSIEGNQSYGNMVEISHEDGNTTLYAHLSETLVSEGETVERGQEIGKIGRTGNVTGPHLHFEVRTATGRVDPTGYITGEDAYEPQDGGSVMRIPRSSSKMPRALGERGRLRVLYYTMTEGVTVSTQTMGSLSGVPAHSIIMADGKTQKAAYCLQSERGATEGNGYTWEIAEQTGQSDVIGTIIALGFQFMGQPTGSPPTPWGRGDSNDKWLATQLLVWAATKGHITIGKNHLINFEAAVDADMAKVAPYTYNSANFLAYYKQLKQRVIDSRKIPSFASYPPENGIPATEKKVINLKWDGSQYSATATDKNGVLDRYDFEEKIKDVNISQNGNVMSISSSAEINSPVTSKEVTYQPQGGRNALACWRTTSGDTSQQDFAVYTDGYDPVHAIITVATSGVPTGDAFLIKTSEDGIVGGISFTISGSDGSSVTKTTDSSGSISLDDLPIYEETPVLDDDGNPVLDELTGNPLTEKGEVITYTASEHTPVRYVRPASQSFTLDSGAVELHFNNRLKKWRVTVTKSDRETGAVAQGDATLAGAVYGIYHNGVLQDSYTTDDSGRFTSKYYVCGTGWTLKEISPSEGYLLNAGTEQIGLRPEETSIEYQQYRESVPRQAPGYCLSCRKGVPMKHRFFLSFLLALTLLTSVCCSPAMAVEAEPDSLSDVETASSESGIMPLARGCGLGECTCTDCSWYYSDQQSNGINNLRHLATVRCTGCSARLNDWEEHNYSNSVCTICGHHCSHSGHEYTKKKVGTCAYEESCYYCKQLIRTSYQHSASYGTWKYYDSEKHVANGSCSKCGSTFSKYENHSVTTSYEQYTASQHKVIKHCSTCSGDITSYAVHSFTYGPWADFDNDQHRRTVKCTSCAYSTYGYAGHTDANGDDLCDVCKHLMTRFSVTVPTSMAMAVSEQGKVTAATNAVILNHSTGAVKLTGLKITAENGWQLIPFARDLAGTKVDSKQIGFRIAGCDTLSQGTQEQLDITNLGNVPKDSSLSLPYAAVVSAMSQPVNEQVLTVEFTVDWAA